MIDNMALALVHEKLAWDGVDVAVSTDLYDQGLNQDFKLHFVSVFHVNNKSGRYIHWMYCSRRHLKCVEFAFYGIYSKVD